MELVQALRRLPIRVRLTLAFALAMALVLTATGAFVYLRMRSELEHTVDQGLRSRSGDVAALVHQADDEGLTQSGRSPLTERGENLAQVVSARGRVLDATPRYRSRPLLTPPELRRALRHTTFVERRRVRGLDSPVRLLATPVRVGNRRTVAVVGALLDDRDEALHRLLVLLAIGGPVALLLASLAGYGVAAAALGPVESMRREAAEVSVSEPGRRLPVPPARDEIGRLGATLNEMLARLETAFERERSFVSDASHELRTPLSILRTELELALRRGRTVEELEAALRSAAEETDRLTQLAEDLLVLARSDQGRLPVRLEELSVGELLGSARERHARRAADAGRGIRVESSAQPPDPGELWLTADRLRLEQALANLIENAIRHGEGEVVLAGDERDGSVEIHVRDQGRGFPEPFLPSAFERFTRADPARSRGGAGLGLAIVAAIAAAHGGTATARNRPPGGADVWMRLPRSPRTASATSPDAQAERQEPE
jgi:two-component system OmpR family sensor kinase